MPLLELVFKTIDGYSIAVKAFLVFLTFYNFHWISSAYLFTNVQAETTILIFLLNSFLVSIPIILAVLLKKYCDCELRLYFLFLISWLSFEHIHSHWSIALPWFHLGNSLSGMPEIVQWLEFTGIGGLTAWILLVNVTVFYFVKSISTHSAPFRKLIVVVAFFVAVLFIPMIISKQLKWSNLGSPIEILTLATNESRSDYNTNNLDYLIDLTSQSVTSETKFIVWPENSIKVILELNRLDSKKVILDIREKILDSARIFIGGSILKGDLGDLYNSALVISKKQVQYHVKTALVPFVESNPIGINWFFDDFGLGNSLFSLSASTVTIPGISIAICFEALFGERIAYKSNENPGLIFILSNEEWTKGGSNQFAKITRMRAIENRKYVIRATNCGITSIISPDGKFTSRVVSNIGVNAIVDKVFQNNGETFYMKNGDYIGRISLTTLMLICLFILVKTPKFYF